MNEDDCEQVAEEYKVKSSVTKESGTIWGHRAKNMGQYSELAERIYPRKPVGLNIVQHHLIRALKF